MAEVSIERIGHKGDGIAKLNGETLHLPKVLAGETVDVVDGKVRSITKSSPERVEPFCKNHDICGGCKFQHWQQQPYATWKRNLVVDALATKGIACTVAPLLDAHGQGRRRVSLHVREINGQWVAGFMAQKSHSLCAIDACPVLVPRLAAAPSIAAGFGPLLGNCDVSLTAADNGLDVSVKAERSAVPRRREALNALMSSNGLQRLSVNGEVFAAPAAPVVGMGKALVALPVQSFLQATALGEALLAHAVSDGLKGAKQVADLFCGVGPFTFRLAEAARVSAFDSDKAAISCLAAAVRTTQGLKPITATARDLFREPLVASELNQFDGVVFDPPRAGAEAQARMLAKSRVKQVVAVACDVQTFARDAGVLLEGGYQLKQVIPVDQFKWTAHLEVVALFQK